MGSAASLPLLEVREASDADAVFLSERLQEVDLAEIAAATGENPLLVLRRGIDQSQPALALVDRQDVPIAVFGAIPDAEDPELGRIWMLGRGVSMESRIAFLRLSRIWVERLQRRWTVLWNVVDCRAVRQIAWLSWCGFRFVGRHESYGVERRAFLEFERRA